VPNAHKDVKAMNILINKEAHFCRNGITIEQLLKEKNFVFPLKTVFLNGKRIPQGEHASTVLKENDVVDVIHMMSGG
jgi:sulfur carrier protein